MKRMPDSRMFNLMLLTIIEVMGVGLIFPLLPELFFSGTNSLMPAGSSIPLKYVCYGISISLWPAGMFFGTPFLGELSDNIGRRKIFQTCLYMTALSYVFSAISVYLQSLSLFFLSRLISGFFAGSYDIAQAAAADISTPETKARNMGWLTMALGIGFIIGPLITSFTADSEALLPLGITSPFWIACTLALFNALMISRTFRDTFVPATRHHIRISRIFSSFIFVFADHRLRYLSFVFLFMVSGWIAFSTGLPLFLFGHFNLSITGIGLFYCLIGVNNIFSILFVQGLVLRHFRLKSIIRSTAIISSAFLTIMILPDSILLVVLFVFLFGVTELLAYSCFLAYFSNRVSPDEQGRAMGGSASVGSIAFAVSSLATAFLANVDCRLPILFSAALFFLAGAMMIRGK